MRSCDRPPIRIIPSGRAPSRAVAIKAPSDAVNTSQIGPPTTPSVGCCAEHRIFAPPIAGSNTGGWDCCSRSRPRSKNTRGRWRTANQRRRVTIQVGSYCNERNAVGAHPGRAIQIHARDRGHSGRARRQQRLEHAAVAGACGFVLANCVRARQTRVRG